MGGTRLEAPSAGSPQSRKVVFASEGDFWAIGYFDSRFLLRDLKGLAYVQRLLRYPNQEVHCLDLVGTSNSDSVEDKNYVVARARGDAIFAQRPGDLGPMLD